MSADCSAHSSAAGPPSPDRMYRWFPGWTMLGFSAAGQYLSAPGQSYSVATLKDPMRSTLGVSETDFALAYGCATLVSAALLPVFGRLVDRLGARVMLPLIAFALGTACFQMSQTRSLGDLYFGFCFVRTLGQGALTLVSVWLVGEWFERRRGVATAISGLGGSLSVMTIPLLNNWITATWGWQTTWQVLSVAVWSVLLLPGILFLRDRPEDLGLCPDGDLPSSGELPAAETGLRAAPPDASWQPREVLKDATFWKLLAVPTTSGLVGTGLMIHQLNLFSTHGLTSQEAVVLMPIQALCATLMIFPAGYLTDRIDCRHLLLAAMVMLAGATLLVVSLPARWMALVYAVLLGLHGSIMRSTGTVVWLNYYGRAHQGTIRGIAYAMMILGAALGPFPLAWSVDATGSYSPALYALLALPVMAGLSVLSARTPQAG